MFQRLSQIILSFNKNQIDYLAFTSFEYYIYVFFNYFFNYKYFLIIITN